MRPRETPMAANTCDGSMAPLAHADAADTHTFASSNRYSNDSLSKFSKHTCAVPAVPVPGASVAVAHSMRDVIPLIN